MKINLSMLTETEPILKCGRRRRQTPNPRRSEQFVQVIVEISVYTKKTASSWACIIKFSGAIKFNEADSAIKSELQIQFLEIGRTIKTSSAPPRRLQSKGLARTRTALCVRVTCASLCDCIYSSKASVKRRLTESDFLDIVFDW